MPETQAETSATNHEWISRQNLIEIGVSEATAYRRIRDGEWKVKRARSRKGAGRPIQLVALDSLSARLQEKWRNLRSVQPRLPASDKPIIETSAVDRLPAEAVFLFRYLLSIASSSYLIARAVRDGTDEDLGADALIGLAQVQMDLIRDLLEKLD